MGSRGKATNPGQLLHVDIVFIAGKPRFFSVDDITGYIAMARMESKDDIFQWMTFFLCALFVAVIGEMH